MNTPAIALFQPDIPQNTGTILRLGACLGVPVHIIEPAGFTLSDKALQRAGMDYLERATLTRHIAWDHFESWLEEKEKRLVLLTTNSTDSYLDFRFQANDILLFGRESSGVPGDVHQRADSSLTIPMVENTRSINLACSAAIVISEALRQLA